MKGRWGIFVCSCGNTLPVDAERIGTPAPLTWIAHNPHAEAEAFARKAAEQGVERVLIGCCEGVEPFRKAFQKVGLAPVLYPVDLKHHGYLPHGDAQSANDKVRRMLRGALHAEEKGVIPQQNSLAVGNRVLLVSDDPAGQRLAARLGESCRLIAFYNGTVEDFPHTSAPVTRPGRLVSVEGRLGDFRILTEAPRSNGGGAETHTWHVDQLVVMATTAEPAVKQRTGVHVIRKTDDGSLEAVAQAIAALTGRFHKPELVRYDADVCAGGAAGMEACGRCIQVCPYDAVTRDAENPLRVRVEHLACEGCGACVAACPTTALRFTDPAPEQIYARLSGMLAAAPDDPQGKPVVMFHCAETGRKVLEEAGHQPLPYTADVLPIEVPCLRNVSPAYLLAPFRLGAAGVGLLGCERCPHGERELLDQNVSLIRAVLEAFGLGGHRLALLTGRPDRPPALIQALDDFAQGLSPSPIPAVKQGHHPVKSREVLARTLETFMDVLHTEPDTVVALDPGQPHALAELDADKCTLCRACAQVCPTHAFQLDAQGQALTYKHVDCVNCGLCERACPEQAIALKPVLRLNRSALTHQVVVQDEPLHCTRCGKPYVNQRALAAVERRLLGLAAQADRFAGDRGAILRMCPSCRGVAAMMEEGQRWEL